jgi:hypothetical protein
MKPSPKPSPKLAGMLASDSLGPHKRWRGSDNPIHWTTLVRPKTGATAVSRGKAALTELSGPRLAVVVQ